MNVTLKSEVPGEAPGLSGPANSLAFISAGQAWAPLTVMAKADLRQTLSLWRLVWALSVFDIKLRYRGSVLGPFWLTLSTAVMVASLGFLYSKLFATDIKTYLPFLSLSLVLWGFIANLTTEGCLSFTAQEAMIRAMRMPLSLHAARVVVRNVLILGHNIVVIVAVFVIMGTVPDQLSFLLVPAFGLWLVDAFALCLLLGILCARYRDIPPIVSSIMQVAFFVSPVIWSPTVLAHRGLGLSLVLMQWNPFYALLDIVRAPLLGTPMNASIWAVAIFYSILLILLTTILFIRTRPQIAYWV